MIYLSLKMSMKQFMLTVQDRFQPCDFKEIGARAILKNKPHKTNLFKISIFRHQHTNPYKLWEYSQIQQ